MAYKRKTADRWDIESCYDGEWSVECSEYTLKEAKEQAKCYRENCSVPIRITKHREPRTEWHDKYYPAKE